MFIFLWAYLYMETAKAIGWRPQPPVRPVYRRHEPVATPSLRVIEGGKVSGDQQPSKKPTLSWHKWR